MKKILALLYLFILSCFAIPAFAQVRLNAPASVCTSMGTGNTRFGTFSIANYNGSRTRWDIYKGTTTGAPLAVLGVDYRVLYGDVGTVSAGGATSGGVAISSTNNRSITIEFLTPATYTVRARTYSNSGATLQNDLNKQVSVVDCPIETCKGSATSGKDFIEDFGTAAPGAQLALDPARGSIEYIYQNTYGLNDNYYAISSQMQLRSEWDQSIDHTGGTNGAMLVANSAIEPKVFYSRRVNGLCPGAVYNFSAWFRNANGKQVLENNCQGSYIYAGVTFEILNATTNAVIASFNTNDVSMPLQDISTDPNRGWQKYGGTFKTNPNATSLTDVIVRIRNNNPGGCGNDIAIDDIQFAYCSPKIFAFFDGQMDQEGGEYTMCAGAATNLTSAYQPAGYFVNPVYRWEYSDNGTTWVKIVGDGDGLTGYNTSVLHFAEDSRYLIGDPTVITYKWFRLTINEGTASSLGCEQPSLPVRIELLPNPKITVAGAQICKGQTATLTACCGYDEYKWRWPTPTPSDSTYGDNIDVSPTVTTEYEVTGRKDYGSGRTCYRTATAPVIVDTMPILQLNLTGPNPICLGQSVTLQIDPSNLAYDIQWRPTGDVGNTTTHTPTTAGPIQYNVDVTNGACVAKDSITVNVQDRPNVTLGTIPSSCRATGQFSVPYSNPTNSPTRYDIKAVAPNAMPGFTAVLNQALPGSPIVVNYPTGTTPGTYTFELTVRNPTLAPCERVIPFSVTVLAASVPPTGITNSSPAICVSGSATLTVQGGSLGTGARWAWYAGGCGTGAALGYGTSITINNITTTTTFFVRAENTAAGPCPATTCASTTVTVYAMPGNANAGPDQQHCEVPAFTMAATAPSPATAVGTWSVVSATGTPVANILIANVNVRNTTVTVPNGASATLRWTITNGTCTSTPDDVVLTNYSQPTTAAAGPDQKLCNVTSFTLAANTPTVGTGAWTTVYGGKTVANPASPTSTITVVPGDSIILRWTVTNGTCTPSTDDITLVSYQQPTTANAGPDQKLCNVTSFTLAANNPTVGTGRWTTIYGGKTVANATSPTSTITVVPGDSIILRWTVTNGNCTPSTDDITLVSYQQPTTANAGPDQKLCNVTSFTLAANNPTVGTGRWTTIYGGKTVANATSPTSTITVVPGDSIILRWTVTNGTCAASTNDVTLVSYAQPTTANAGPDQKLCNVTSFTLAANNPTVGTGRWTTIYGGKTVANATSPTSTITVVPGDSIILRWTVTNGTCAASTNDVTLVSYAQPTTANAGPDQKLCNVTSFTLAANTPTVGTGRWTTIYGGKTVANPTSPTSTITVAPGDSIILRWTVTNGNCTPSTNDVTLVSYAQPTTADAGPDQAACFASTLTMAANTPTVGTGRWTIVYGAPTINAPTSPTTTVTLAPGDSVILRWTITNGTCAASSDDVTLVKYAIAAAAAAGPDQKLCNVTSFTLAANAPSVATASGRWSIIYGTPTLSSLTDPAATVTVAPGDSVILRWTITNGVCPATTDDVTLVSYQQPTTAAAGPDQKLCNVTSFTLAANAPIVGTGTWTTIYGGKTVANATNPTSTITVAPGDSIILRWTVTNGNCAPSTDDVTLVSYAQPTTAAAGPDQKMCNVTSFTLAANTPTVGTGRWTTIYGGKTVANATSPTSTITVAPGDSIILRWTVTNGNCTPSTDDVTLVSYAQPTTAAAGPDQKLCNVTSFTLAANAPTVGTGRWTTIYGGKTVANPTSPTSTITVAPGDSIILRWTVTNGNCTPSTNDVTLVSYQQPTTADAGPDQGACFAATLTMAANTPTVGTGRWTIVYGAPTINAPTSPTTTVTLAPGDSVILRWTITNGTCAASSDDVTLVKYAIAPAAAAGPDQKLCNVTSFTLAANAPGVATASGRWSIIYGTPTLSSLTDPAATVTVAPGDSVILRWTITNGVCPATTDDVTLVSYQQPTTAAAGPDQKLCNVTSFTLAANAPTVGTGTWTTIYGGKTVTNATNPTSTITVAPGDSIILRWTVTNGNCAPSTDDVTLVSYQQPTTAAAGPDQNLCNVTSFTLAANAPTVGTGRWTTIYGGKTVANATSPTSTITVAPSDSIILRWTVTNGNCTPSTDDVTLVSYQQPTTAAAGPDQKLCNVTSFTLAANTPTVGTGRWTTIYGGKTVTNPTSPTSTITVAPGDSIILRWTVTNGNCTPSTDDVTLVSYEQPTVAAAGPDQAACFASTFIMAANAPTVGTGRWTVIYGSPTIAAPTSPTTTVTLAPGDSVILRWTITNGNCAASSDDVTLVKYAIAPAAAAGPDQKLCNVTSFTLAANAPGVATAAGRWTIIYGTPTLSSVTDPAATVTVAPGDSVILRWTITNGVCPATTDDVVLVSYQQPTIAAAGPDQKLCNVTSFTLAANAPAVGTGRWTTIYGGKTVANATSPTSTITVAPGDSIILRWTVTNGNCPPSTDDITLVSYQQPTTAAAGPDQKLCGATSITLAANAPTVGTGRWTTIYGGKTVANATSPTSFIAVAPGDSIILRWTVTNGNCTPSTDDVTLVSYETASTAAAGPDQKLCNVTSFTLAANTPAIGTGVWSTVYGTATVANPTNPTTTITVAPGDSVVLRWTITNGSNCPPSRDDVTLVSYQQPTIAAAGPDQKMCNVTSFTLAANAPTVGTGRWTTIYGGKTVANATSPTSTITVAPGDSIILRWTVTNGTCPPSTDDITLVSYQQPTTAAAGPDQKMCNVTSFTLAANAPTAGTGRWTTIYGGKTVANATSPTSTITVAPGDSIILRWTVTNGNCTPSFDDVTLVSYAQPTTAAAGPDQKMCNVTSFTLAANAPTAGTGRWTTIYGGKTVTNATSPTSTITVAPGDSIILRWTVTNGNCTPSTDDVTLVSYQQPTTAAAGPDQKMCNVTSFTLAANAPTAGTGRWTTIYGGKTVANPASPTSTITVVPGDSIVLRWTVTNGNCAPSTDDVTLVSYRQPTTAAAGPDQKLCNVTSFTLAANAPTAGTGRWTTIYGTRTVTNPTSPTSTITVAPGDSIILRWTVTNGNCTPSTDDVTLVSYAQPTTANAGPDQKACNVTSFTLAANAPTVGTGRWTVVYGTPTITAPTNPRSTVTVAAGDSVILRWTVTNGNCTPSTDNVTLVSYRMAAAAAAGPDQKLCNVNTFTLAANAPSVPTATGRWTIVYGTPTLSSMTDPRATVTVAIGDSVVLRWTITNGACPTSTDDVTLVSYQQAAIATAGPDQKMCNVPSFTMGANTPGVATATGTWTRVYGNATISNVNDPRATVTVALGDSVVLRWTIMNGTCPVTSDDVVLINHTLPTVAAAGPDQQQCSNGAFTLAANTATAGTGRWTIVSGTATIANVNSPTTTVTVPAGGTVTLRWSISNGVCPPTTDDVILSNLNAVLGNTITADQTICLNEAAAPLGGGTLTGGNGTYTYQWQSSTVSATTGFTNIPGATNATYSPGTLTQDSIWFRRIVNSGPCMNNISNAVKIMVITKPPVVVFVPAPLTVNCKLGMDYTTLFGTPQFSHTPYIGQQLTITFTDASAINGCVRTFTRTWTATDRCGMTTTASQTISVVDNDAPVFQSAAPANITVNCDAVPAPVNLTAYDSCFGVITVTPTETRQNITGACANNYRLIRTWTATDGCNNSVTLTQTITVQDTTRPVFTVAPPRDTTVNCNSVPAAATLTATDNCTPGVITVTSTDVRQNIPGAQCADYYQIIRTWIARDECGNTATVKQTITVQDTTRPVFSIPQPANVTVDCDKVPAWPVVTATDNCSANVTVVTSEQRTSTLPACANNYRLIRTWTAKDNCGNTATMQQIITVQDTTRPVFTIIPRDTTVSCDAVPPPANNVIATDNCAGNVKLSRTQVRQDIPGACASNYLLIRTWTATDECGNVATVRQVVTVTDTTRPVIAPAPADLVVNCGDSIPVAPVLTATDNCDPAFPKRVTVVEDPYVKDLCAGYTIIRRWRIADACGNQAIERVQRITVNPCPKPVLDPALPMNCSDNPSFTLKLSTQVNNPTYILVGVTPANAVQVPLAQKSATFNLNNATQASFIVQDGVSGCISDTVVYNLQYSNKPMVNLGNDTTICGGNSLILDAGAANFGYTIRWSTGETTQRIQVSAAGTYWVSVTNGVCVTTDTIHVALVPMPLVNLPDAAICRGQSVKLDAFVDGASYLWSTGATTSSILVSTQEEFWVRVTKSGCITIDTVNVTINPPPDISLNRDTTICPDQSIMLTVNVANGGSIRWATGATTSSIVVNQPGLYWVTVTRDNCMVRDTVNVRLQPGINVELGPNREICPGSSITVDGTTQDAISYLWDDGDSNPVKAFNATGKYRLAVMDRFCQRVYMDSLNVRVMGTPFINLGNDTMMCIGETLRLRADGSNITRVLWSDGSTGPFLDVTKAGTYSVTVFNDCGSYTDQITVDYTQCDPKPTFPNAFSPNNDGRNDFFRPVVRGPMYEYELRIFNRWGELIYLGRDSKKGWDGRYQGQLVGVGTYVWWLTYKKMPNGNPNIIKGEVTVIR